MASIPKVDEGALQQICNVIADTNDGLSGSEIGKLLSSCSIADPEPTSTKRIRLFTALRAKQEKDGCSNNVFAFIQRAMDPIRYTVNPETFETRRGALNMILAFRGYEIKSDGIVRLVEKVDNLDDAQKRANRGS